MREQKLTEEQLDSAFIDLHVGNVDNGANAIRGHIEALTWERNQLRKILRFELFQIRKRPHVGYRLFQLDENDPDLKLVDRYIESLLSPMVPEKEVADGHG